MSMGKLIEIKKGLPSAVPFYAQGRIRKIVANATCAPRGEQWRRAFPYLITQGRIRKIVANATCAPRGANSLLTLEGL